MCGGVSPCSPCLPSVKNIYEHIYMRIVHCVQGLKNVGASTSALWINQVFIKKDSISDQY